MTRTAFYLACIQTDPDSVGDYIAEAKQLGVEIKAPDINMSQVKTCITGNSIYFGLHDVKNAGVEAARWLVLTRNKLGGIKSRQHLEDAIEDQFIIWEAAKEAPGTAPWRKVGKSPRQLCPMGAINAWEQAGCFDSLSDDWDLMERSRLQRDLLGISFVDVYSYLTELHSDDLLGIVPIDQIPQGSMRADAYALLTGIEHRTTRASAKPGFANKPYVVLIFEWQSQSFKVTSFESKEYELDRLYLMQLAINDKGMTLKHSRCLQD